MRPCDRNPRNDTKIKGYMADQRKDIVGFMGFANHSCCATRDAERHSQHKQDILRRAEYVVPLASR